MKKTPNGDVGVDGEVRVAVRVDDDADIERAVCGPVELSDANELEP